MCLQLKKSLRQARLKYELSIISLSKHNPKLIYSYVKSQRKLPNQIRSLIDPQGNTITDMPKIVNMLNDQFFSAFNPATYLPVPSMPPRSLATCQVAMESFSSNKVRLILNKLNKYKSQGSDKLNPYVLRECADALAEAFSIIFCQSFKSGKLPTYWKEANVTPA